MGIFLIILVISISMILNDIWTRSNEMVIYVGKDGNDSWSGSRPDPGKDGEDGPFATLERAREEVRRLVSENLTRDVTVQIGGGTYYLEKGLVLGPGDSGTEKHSVTYAAAPGEDVYIIGGVSLESWDQHGGEIWRSRIPNGTEPLQVFENGRRMEVARTPQTGYFGIEGPVAGSKKTKFRYSSRDFDPTGWDLSDATVFIWPGHNWFSHEKTLDSIDRDSRVITMGSDSGYTMISGNRYFIRNVLSLLDVPGECQIDRTRGYIYGWPSDGPVDKQEFVASTATNVVSIKGTGEAVVRNVHLRNLSLGISNQDVVWIGNSENCSVRGCRIENGGQSGVMVWGYAQGIEVYGNLIRFNGLHGVSLHGLGLGGEDVNHHNLVENNHIHHCGRLVGHGYGVRIYQSGHNRILHNDIHHMPRYGTTIKGMRYQVLKDQVEGVTWENRHDFLHSRNNLIAYNHIHHVNLDSQDTGAMESWGPGRGNVYDHNLIHDVGNYEFTLQSGMYLDDATDYFTVTNNIIFGVVGAGGDQPIFTKGIGNRIENNILVVGPDNSAAIRSMAMGGERGDTHEYVRNIFYFETRDGDIYGFINWNDTRVAESDLNLFWKPAGELTVSGGPGEGDLENWLALFDGRYDMNSVVADPLFMNPAQRDFRLRDGSPAFDLGFNEIDVSEIGLKPDYPSGLREGWEDLYRIPRALVYNGGK